jgi:CRP/FNR family transcriptional regulator, anaerobic regulatory protein
MDLKRRATGSVDKLGDLPQFAALCDDTRAELAALCRLRGYRAGQTVVPDGEPSAYVGFVKTGFLRMQKTSSDGRQHIVGLLVEGDMFGQIFSGPNNFAIEAATSAEICAFQRAPFEALLERSPGLERLVFLNILNELDRTRDWMVILSGQKVTGRLAGFLIVMCSRYSEVDHVLTEGEEGLEVKIPISRIDLAHLLGTRPESISRAFHALADAGDIRILRPDLVRITDLEALAAHAGEEDALSGPSLRGLVAAASRR